MVLNSSANVARARRVQCPSRFFSKVPVIKRRKIWPKSLLVWLLCYSFILYLLFRKRTSVSNVNNYTSKFRSELLARVEAALPFLILRYKEEGIPTALEVFVDLHVTREQHPS